MGSWCSWLWEGTGQNKIILFSPEQNTFYAIMAWHPVSNSIITLRLFCEDLLYIKVVFCHDFLTSHGVEVQFILWQKETLFLPPKQQTNLCFLQRIVIFVPSLLAPRGCPLAFSSFASTTSIQEHPQPPFLIKRVLF